jgi:hypothetical protein
VGLPFALDTLAALLFPRASVFVANPLPAYRPLVNALLRVIVDACDFEHARHVHDGIVPLRRSSGDKV